MTPDEALKLWTDPEVVAMLDRQGWPEWDPDSAAYDHARISLSAYGGRLIYSDADGGSISIPMDYSVALALLRDDSRRRLEAAGLFVYPSIRNPGQYNMFDMRERIEDGYLVTRSATVHFGSCDAALIAARKKIEGVAQ